MEWIPTSEHHPVWEDGYVKIKTEDGEIFEGKFNELGLWWRVPTPNGILRLDEEKVTHWKPIAGF
jgi:hypothetical protein